MSGMFAGCMSLKELDLSSFNTNNVTDMREMFITCSSLKEINLSSFNTDNVTDMSFMFDGCKNLKSITKPNDISKAGALINLINATLKLKK